MWIYDGDEWIEEGVRERTKKSEPAWPEDLLELPEMLEVEIPRKEEVPPPPHLPMP